MDGNTGVIDGPLLLPASGRRWDGARAGGIGLCGCCCRCGVIGVIGDDGGGPLVLPAR